MNSFQGLINKTISLEVPLVDEVLALFLLGYLGDTSRHIGQRKTGREAIIHGKGKVQPTK